MARYWSKRDGRAVDAKTFGVNWYEVGGARVDLLDAMYDYVAAPDTGSVEGDYLNALDAFDRLDDEI